MYVCIYMYVNIYIWGSVLGLELRALCLQSLCHLSHTLALFALDYFLASYLSLFPG
jgi:hypothetical protein